VETNLHAILALGALELLMEFVEIHNFYIGMVLSSIIAQIDGISPLDITLMN